MDRRSFLKTMGTAAGTVCASGALTAQAKEAPQDTYAILVDTTLCVGCRACEEACATRHNLPEVDTGDDTVFEVVRNTSETQWMVINRTEVDGEEIFARKACMHCAQPACASACLTKAMIKTDEGPVVWREDKCMGCRFCMLSCPFDIPKFEYDSLNPRIQKCRMCWEDLKEGEQPACVEECPEEAIVYGKRTELLEIAKQRIYQNPGSYVSHIYGEHEAGGTGLLYLSAVPFEKLGFRTDLGTESYPELTTGFLYSVPIVLLMWPGFLLGVSRATRHDADEEE